MYLERAEDTRVKYILQENRSEWLSRCGVCHETLNHRLERFQPRNLRFSPPIPLVAVTLDASCVDNSFTMCVRGGTSLLMAGLGELHPYQAWVWESLDTPRVGSGPQNEVQYTALSSWS